MVGRSECPKCHHILSAWDLFPLASYLYTEGKCRYCRAHISTFYPMAEILMGCIFAILTYSAIRIGIDVGSIKMLLLLLFGFVTGVYVLYDLMYMEIPDQIMIPTIYLLLIVPFLEILFN